jgi:hypothetical protein
MPLEFHDMSTEQSGGKLKLAIVGHEKNGKSWLAATGRKNVLFHGFDQRSEALSGKKGVYELSYIDPQWPKQPESAQNFLTTLGKLEESLDLSKLGFKVPEGTLVRTNVIDSVQTFAQSFQKYALYNSKDIRRELTIGSMKVFLPGGWDAWNAEMVPVENAILRLLALPTDTIIVLHETAEETADSTSEKPRFTGRVGVFPVRYQRLIKYFNEVWRVKLTQVTVNNRSAYIPRVYPLPNYEFDCATAMDLDAQEEPNIEAMIAKSERRQLEAGKPSNTAIAGRSHPELQSSDGQKKQLPQLKI